MDPVLLHRKHRRRERKEPGTQRTKTVALVWNQRWVDSMGRDAIEWQVLVSMISCVGFVVLFFSSFHIFLHRSARSRLNRVPF